MEVQGHPDDVSLLVRLWVEMSWAFSWGSVLSRQPPCEAVSWNTLNRRRRSLQVVSLLVRLWVEILRTSESLHQYIVSLLVRLWVEMESLFDNYNLDNVSLLVRLWVEIMSISWDPEPKNVSLLVRLWVEMFSMGIVLLLRLLSASLWGCELKWQSHCLRLFQHAVSLLVRLWVEISRLMKFSRMLVVSLLVRLWVEISM